jgi:hypothetical protein
MQLDHTNRSSSRQLRTGRKSLKAIADKLNLSENTVRSRVQRMSEEGLLEISSLINPDSLDGHRAILIGIKLKTTDLVAKGAEFSRLKGCHRPLRPFPDRHAETGFRPVGILHQGSLEDRRRPVDGDLCHLQEFQPQDPLCAMIGAGRDQPAPNSKSEARNSKQIRIFEKGNDANRFGCNLRCF